MKSITEYCNYQKWQEESHQAGAGESYTIGFQYKAPLYYKRSDELKGSDEYVYNHIKSHFSLKVCCYCGEDLITQQRELTQPYLKLGIDSTLKRRLNVCETCGWWFFTEDSYTVIDDAEGQDNIKFSLFEGILKEFSVADEIPIEILRRHLERNPEDLYEIHPTQFERLVTDIYSDFFKCEARHVGDPGDNGIDIYAVIAEEPHLIQVKRRQKPSYIEPIVTVRDLIGTLILKDCKKGHIVTDVTQL